ncbi:MAG: adenosylmethionine decarboxylase [Patescibacteria group bacterium]|nr:adenosylmethionine decarboxylase [Patescibacteria group bacterium]
MAKSKKIHLKRSYRIGREIIADLKGCDARIINDEQLLKRLVQEAIHKTNHHLLNLVSKKFSPVGITIVGILAESHISVHTYPEIGYVGIDIFTCGANKPEPILDYLQEKIGAKDVSWTFIKRGTMRQWKTILQSEGFRREIEVIRTIHKRQTPYQNLELVRTKKLGTCLFSNGILQYATTDSNFYDDQMLKKLKLIKAESVLIIGGGDCSVLKKIIPNKHLKDIYMFEQDQQVVEIAKKYLGANKVLRDPRLKMFYGDALETIPYLKDKKIDYAVVDIISASEVKFKKFYNEMMKLLHEIKVPAWSACAGNILETQKLKCIKNSAEKFYDNIMIEDKWFLSGGMTRFLFGEKLRK